MGTAGTLAFCRVFMFSSLASKSVFSSPIKKKKKKLQLMEAQLAVKVCILLLFMRSSNLIYALFRTVF